jgi:hypothetical protein
MGVRAMPAGKVLYIVKFTKPQNIFENRVIMKIMAYTSNYPGKNDGKEFADEATE